MRKTKFCLTKTRIKEKVYQLGEKKAENFDSKRKQNKFHKNMGNNHRGHEGNNYKGFKPQDSAIPSTVPNKNPTQKEPLKCWECGSNTNLKIVQQGNISLMPILSRK